MEQKNESQKKSNDEKFAKENELFIKAIANELRRRAKEDPLLVPKFKNPDKNIVDCCKFIIEEVKKTGRQGFADEEIFSLAIHYYEEPDLKAPDAVSRCKVITNTAVHLTEDEIRKAKEAALEEIKREEKKRLSSKQTQPQTPLNKPEKPKAKASTSGNMQLNLFGEW